MDAIKNISNVSRMQGVYSASSYVQPTKKTSRPDNQKEILTLSAHAQDFKAVYEVLSKVPDIREDKVADIMNRMNRGEYNVSSKDLAAKMLSKFV
jgi:negative regulator of flagellin synthesis FlgM